MKLTALRLAKSFTNSALQATEQNIEVKVPWGKLAALTWGNPSNSPVLLCHGRFDTCSSYRPLVNLLPDNYFYVSVDLPGYGYSDPFPRGAKINAMDFVPTIARVKEHFRWDQFAYIGHSLGALFSKFYNIAYPGHLSRIVELDPAPAYWPTHDFRTWYHEGYGPFYSDEHYQKLNSGYENAPKYTYEEVRKRLMKARGLDEKSADHVLERCLEPAGDGLFRLTHDQRLKLNTLLPFPKGAYIDLYTASKTPILAILSPESMKIYKNYPMVTDDNAWPNRNYRHVILNVGHDVHLHSPEECAKLITEFLKK
ncbi:serine hydrolase-like protein [Ostrinia nubilalis]|uniref:serine hydrolase-like protein n=1 Tax=Ostrinia nubilalis TaxID=29057 RepID=UPI003082641B